jgi:4-hydroxy-tetrahydrodipicolinate reductase
MSSTGMKISLWIHGASGRMGRTVMSVAAGIDGVAVRGVLDLRAETSESPAERGVPRFSRLPEGAGGSDVVIDFSRPEAMQGLVKALSGSGTRLVSGTTGLGEAGRALLQKYSEETAVFYDENMSYGISVVKRILEVAAPLLAGYADREIIEWHHRAKLDHPSGTALALARVLSKEGGVISGRGEGSGGPEETHVHSVRVGGVPGEHQIVFGADEEVVTIAHRALHRRVFARGAIRAAQFIAGKDPGFYSMEHLVRRGND